MDFLRLLESIRTPALDTVMYLITMLGDELFFMVFAITMFWCVDKCRGYYLLTVGFVGTVINQFLKLIFRIPRPWILDRNFTIVESARAGATGYSFPSGHTQNIVGTMGGVARSSKRRWVQVICVIILLAVAFSRMYLGVHTPKDVGASFLVAVILVFALHPLFQKMEERPDLMYPVFGAMILIGILYLLFVRLYPFPADIDKANLESGTRNAYTLLGATLGITVAYWLDRRYVHFSTEAPLAGQILKLVLGLILILMIKTGLKPILNTVFGGHYIADLIRYLVIVIFAGAVWPMTFRYFRQIGKR